MDDGVDTGSDYNEDYTSKNKKSLNDYVYNCEPSNGGDSSVEYLVVTSKYNRSFTPLKFRDKNKIIQDNQTGPQIATN